MTDFFENLLSNEDFKTAWGELKAENERLKEGLRPFKDDYFKGLDNKVIAELAKKSIRITAENRRLENCLQEIKAIAEECTTCGDCFNCKYTEHCSTDIEAQALGVCRMILKLITKAEEE